MKKLKIQHEFFIGIDSDGCVFDTMEIKHKECFIPNIIKHWNLQAVSKYARDAAEFVNLYSKWRGINRFPALVMSFDLLREWDEVKKRGRSIPEVPELRKFIDSGRPLSNSSFKEYIEEVGTNDELKTALEWSNAVNQTVDDMVYGMPPFPYVRESLEKMNGTADMMVVSATPTDALEKEWSENEIDNQVRLIAGQEMGPKKQHLQLAATGKYKPEHILMIGDAPGDMNAAKANNALFYPIMPGNEDASWQRFYDEASDRFIRGEYAGSYEENLIQEFLDILPDTPPWKR
ncbi:HAD family hydrolase [Natronogracilivirga saccharolytica]|uniref:HAD family hydrolase n=1 Tax=Natronogracilivirga saccharolytica TaxID=2812953 RepID=UPI001B3051A2|nr:HAD hydrolase-like protein [Natronogracilivirga saccharolytica]